MSSLQTMRSLSSSFFIVNYEYYHPVCGKTNTFKWQQITQHDTYMPFCKRVAQQPDWLTCCPLWIMTSVRTSKIRDSLIFASVQSGKLVWRPQQYVCWAAAFVFCIPKSSCLVQCCALARHSVHTQNVHHSSVLVAALCTRRLRLTPC